MRPTWTFVSALVLSHELTSAFRVSERDAERVRELLARQEEEEGGGEKFQCHSDCGTTITEANPPDSCEDATWTGLLEACLECTLEFDIWQHYGEQVSGAAEACGLDATPSAAEAGEADEAAEPEESSSPTPTGSTDESADEQESPSSTPTTESDPDGAANHCRPAALPVLLGLAALAVQFW